MTERVDETWVYLGRRLTATGKIAHAWRDPSGEELLYGKLSGTAVGGIYTVGTVREGESIRAYPPVWTGEVIDDETERARLAAADRAAMTDKSTRDAERRYGSSTELEDALASLERIARTCRTWQEHEALQIVVRERIGKAWRGR